MQRSTAARRDRTALERFHVAGALSSPPMRLDAALGPDLHRDNVGPWMQRARVLCSNGRGMGIAVKSGYSSPSRASSIASRVSRTNQKRNTRAATSSAHHHPKSASSTSPTRTVAAM